LPPSQASLEEDYRNELSSNHGIVFDSLLAITNMPIKRFADDLYKSGKLSEYFQLLAKTFNAATLPGLMCRGTVNIQWDGKLYDCDFNAALDMPVGGEQTDIWSIGEFGWLDTAEYRIDADDAIDFQTLLTHWPDKRSRQASIAMGVLQGLDPAVAVVLLNRILIGS
jgi:hypothetical protein